MAPAKSLPPAAKQALILAHLRSTRTCHTIKDLEKMLPAVASINSMQVKDYVQALTDENKVHVEKIGSGNWYWAWPGEERKERGKVREGLAKELARYLGSAEEVGARIAALKEEIMRERAGAKCHDGEGGGVGDVQAAEEEEEEEEKERKALMGEKARLEAEVTYLLAELKRFTAVDGAAGVERKEAETQAWRAAAEMWTDNIYVLEAYLKKLAGGDREILEAVRRECYGDEYVEGEGLRELDA
ncbi:hypothetical protein VTO42DRAFT_5759 [Malbranchea cinnamomea]